LSQGAADDIWQDWDGAYMARHLLALNPEW
jgi:hypothetical protein